MAFEGANLSVWTNGYNNGTKVCSNIRCHNGIATPAFNLTGTNITCGGCHNNGGTDSRPSGASVNSPTTTLPPPSNRYPNACCQLSCCTGNAVTTTLES